MPTLQDYEGLAPFSLDELVDAANSVLRDRPKLHVSKRTVRYYIQMGVLPPPQGSPKYARYGMEHLLRVTGARCLLDQGQSLQGAARDLNVLMSGPLLDACLQVQRLIDDQRDREIYSTPPMHQPSHRVVESKERIYSSPNFHASMDMDIDEVRRIRLTSEATLELRGAGDIRVSLEAAADALIRLIEDPQKI